MKRSLQIKVFFLFVILALFVMNRTAHAEPPMMKEQSVRPHIEARSQDGRYSVALGGFIQGRYSLAFENTALHTSRFDTPRTRFFIFGHVFTPNARYRLMMGTAPSSLSVVLYDAYIDYRITDALRVRTGHFKIPVYREWIESARLLASVERTILTQVILPGRDWGGMITGELFSSHLDYALSIFNGGAKLSTTGPLIAGRLAWNVLGRSIEGEVDFENSSRAIVIGASGYSSFDAVQFRHYGGGIEVAYREKGLDLTVEVMARERWNGQTRSFTGGFYARGDKYIPALRASFGGRLTRMAGFQESATRTEVDLDAAYYPAEHNLKIATNFGVGHFERENRWEPFVLVQVQAGF